MKKITVFTPTYNRAYCLGRLYESLCNQSNQNFNWLIIDDGSTDNTEYVVKNWIESDLISIHYHYQRNLGMVQAHNTAHHLISTELSVCIDSDDFMPKDAIERILDLWNKYGYPGSAGLIGLDAFKDGRIVGDLFPAIKECTFTELTQKYKIIGDKKFVHNKIVFDKFLPYPYYENEKHQVTSYLYLLIEKEHKWLIFNEVFCVVEYMTDGLSKNLFNQYLSSPKSYADYRILRMKSSFNYYDKFKNAIHYVSSSIIAKNKNILKEVPYKITVILAVPFGMLLFLYIKYTRRKSLMKQ